MKKILKIISVNIILILLIVFSADFAIYNLYAFKACQINPKVKNYLSYKITPVHSNSYFYKELKEFFNNTKDENYGENGRLKGRIPIGLEYKDKPAIILFGSSCIYGQLLKIEQTFGYKLSKIKKRTIYNRAMPGRSFQQMYMQTLSDELYETIPNADTVIYSMVNPHYIRMKIRNFSVLEYWERPVFIEKNGKLYLPSKNNKLINYIKNLYLSRHINHKKAIDYISNPQNAQKITNEILLYFTESRKELEKHYGKNLKFYILFIEDGMYNKLLRQKLEENGFKTISVSELTDKDLHNPEYLLDDKIHPKEIVWDIMTPLISEKIELTDK